MNDLCLFLCLCHPYTPLNIHGLFPCNNIILVVFYNLQEVKYINTTTTAGLEAAGMCYIKVSLAQCFILLVIAPITLLLFAVGIAAFIKSIVSINGACKKSVKG